METQHHLPLPRAEGKLYLVPIAPGLFHGSNLNGCREGDIGFAKKLGETLTLPFHLGKVSQMLQIATPARTKVRAARGSALRGGALYLNYLGLSFPATHSGENRLHLFSGKGLPNRNGSGVSGSYPFGPRGKSLDLKGESISNLLLKCHKPKWGWDIQTEA